MKHQLLLLAEENAGAAVANHLRDEEIGPQAVEELKRLVRLDIAPRRIEGFDISNTMGNQSVASMVVWEDGQMKKSDYRKFRIKTVDGANDFASMQEVVMRRYGDDRRSCAPGSHSHRRGVGPTGGRHGRTETGRPGTDCPSSDWPKRVAIKRSVFSCRDERTLSSCDRPHRPPISCSGFATKPIALRSPFIGNSEAKPCGLRTRPDLRHRRDPPETALEKFGSLDRIAEATDEQLRSAGIDLSTVAALRKALTPS